MIKMIFLCVLFIPFILSAQINDDFSDGNFTQNPIWIGDTDNFIINNNYQLQLNDTDEGVSYLVTENNSINDTQWQFWVRLGFTPSDNNHARIYLVSDSDNLKDALNGYFLQIGKTGTDNKRLYFHRQDGENTTELMAGNQNLATGSNNLLRIKVTRDNAGNWQIWADGKGGELFLPQGTAFDNTYTNTRWFGFLCRYTSTNSNRFYFDDIYIGEIIPDTAPPEVLRTKVSEPNMLEIYFSKVVEKTSAETQANYIVDQGLGAPLIASRNPEKPNVVQLMFAENFEENTKYQISISNIKDISDNVLEYFDGEFVYFVAERHDVVFNELMVNPSPPVDMPEHEYIELYNTTQFEIDLEGWKLQDRTAEREIPYASVPPNGYLVLSTEAGYDELSQYGNVIAVPGFTSASLTHSGTELVLLDDNDYIVSFVDYSDEWYQTPSKEDGGWSLEKIDPYNFSGRKDNWRASEDPRGGTPGETNSIRDENPDLFPPDLIRAGFIDESNIVLFFSEPMDKYTLMDVESYYIAADQHEIGDPVTVKPVPPAFEKVELTLPEEMQKGLIYDVSVDNNLADYAGNNLERNKTRIAIPEAAEKFDVVINEILFNPPEQASQRYIEIYNRSEKVADLKDYRIASKDTVEDYLETVRTIAEESFLFFPGDYVVLTTSPEDVKRHYMTNNPYGFIRVGSMPRMTNSGGIAVFASKSFDVIDMVVYDEEMHYSLLRSKSGVALERLNYHRPSDSRHNWHSASEGAGFGTPGYKNSQFTHDPEKIEDDITVYPEIFSPDNTGHDDVLNIHFKFEEPGFTANIDVYDSRGRHTKTIARSRLLGTEEVVVWDGTTDDNQKANIGIYIVFIELFDPNGNVRKYKKSAVLAGRL